MAFEKKITLKKRIAKRLSAEVQLTSSKSESNRLLLIQASADHKLVLKNLSEARDTQTMQRILQKNPNIWDVKDAGTTMRFLTAFLAIRGDGQTMTGTDRMKLRPIAPLVDALRIIGADIQYLEEEGFPPLKVLKTEKQLAAKISIPGNISSQYISALLMIAPCLPDGLEVTLTSEIFSRPYIEMTLSLMAHFGVKHEWRNNTIVIAPQSYSEGSYTVENDWSGASYWYSFLSLSQEGGNLFLPNLNTNSTQGDQQIMKIMDSMGVRSHFKNGGVEIEQKEIDNLDQKIDFKNFPDLAQTVMTVAAIKGIRLSMTGLESLRIKETDRIQAMQTELAKLGAVLFENENAWMLEPSSKLPDQIEINTYDDHRMAMAFAPLCHIMDVTIENPNVVNKSYPNFWEELKRFLLIITVL